MISPFGHSVLIVEDEPGFRFALRTHFSRHGWSTAVASGAREARTALGLGSFDLIVSDMRMLDGNGFDVLAAAQQIAPAAAVLFLTGSASVPEAVEAVRGGAIDYLVKPVPFDQLLAVAERHVQQRDSPRTPSTSSTSLRPMPVAAYHPAQHKPADNVTAAEPMRTDVTLSDLERTHLMTTLQRVGGNRTHAAQMLGISVRTLRNKVRQYDLPPRRYA